MPVNLRTEADLIEVPSRDGVHKSFEVGTLHYFIDEREVAAAAFKQVLFPEES